MAEPMRVLIAEDDDATRSTFANAVRSLGHTCKTARDGREAWEIHESYRSEVIICDRSMPWMDGIELCRAVRLHEDDSNYTYFVFVTAHDTPEDLLLGMNVGADDYLTKPIDLKHFEARLAAAWRVVSHQRALVQSNANLRRDSERHFLAARVDALTTLGNRRQLDEDLLELRLSTATHGCRYAVGIGDIDWFKSYNDSYGHLMGDRALTAVGEVFRDQLRSDDRCYRYGGEEFVVLLRELSDGDAATALERVRRHTASLGLAHAGSPIGTLTISIGLAVATLGPDLDFEAWFKRADRALYQAKANGRNRVVTDLDSCAGERRSSPPEHRSARPEHRSSPPERRSQRPPE